MHALRCNLVINVLVSRSDSGLRTCLHARIRRGCCVRFPRACMQACTAAAGAGCPPGTVTQLSLSLHSLLRRPANTDPTLSANGAIAGLHSKTSGPLTCPLSRQHPHKLQRQHRGTQDGWATCTAVPPLGSHANSPGLDKNARKARAKP